MLQIKTIYFYFSVLFIYKRDFLKLLFLCLPLLLSRCGNQGCRTAEEQYYGGIWQDSQYLTLKPINNSVLAQETNLGFYILKNGVSQSKAGKNTWQSLRFNNGDDVIVRSGNLFSVDINGTAYLNGYNETIHLPLSNWIGLNGGSYSIPTGEMKTKTVSEAEPSLIRVERTYKQDATSDFAYVVTLENGEQTVKLDSSNDTHVINYNKKCDAVFKHETLHDINYLWYFPKAIHFKKWFNASTREVEDGNITVTVAANNLYCKVEKDTNALWYACYFTYEGEKFKYRRRVTPIVDLHYVGFEEQLISETYPPSNKKDEYGNLYNNTHSTTTCSDTAQSTLGGNAGSICDREQSLSADDLDYDSYKKHFVFCIRSGKESFYNKDANNQTLASGQSFATCNLFEIADQYNHIIYVKEQSPVLVQFKTYAEIFTNKQNEKLLTYPSTYYAKVDEIDCNHSTGLCYNFDNSNNERIAKEIDIEKEIEKVTRENNEEKEKELQQLDEKYEKILETQLNQAADQLEEEIANQIQQIQENAVIELENTYVSLEQSSQTQLQNKIQELTTQSEQQIALQKQQATAATEASIANQISEVQNTVNAQLNEQIQALRTATMQDVDANMSTIRSREQQTLAQQQQELENSVNANATTAKNNFLAQNNAELDSKTNELRASSAQLLQEQISQVEANTELSESEKEEAISRLESEAQEKLDNDITSLQTQYNTILQQKYAEIDQNAENQITTGKQQLLDDYNSRMEAQYQALVAEAEGVIADGTNTLTATANANIAERSEAIRAQENEVLAQRLAEIEQAGQTQLEKNIADARTQNAQALEQAKIDAKAASEANTEKAINDLQNNKPVLLEQKKQKMRTDLETAKQKEKDEIIKLYKDRLDETIENMRNALIPSKQCRLVVNKLQYGLIKYNANGYSDVADEPGVLDHEISFCKKDCIDLCTNYFSGGYRAKANYEPKKINSVAGKFINYLPVDVSTDVKVDTITDCWCLDFTHTLKVIGRNTTQHQQEIYNACNHSDGWYGLYAKQRDDQGNYDINAQISPFSVARFLHYFDDYSNNYYTDWEGCRDNTGTLKNYLNGVTTNFSKDSSEDAKNCTTDICHHCFHVAYGICTPYAKLKGKCEQTTKEQCPESNKDCSIIKSFTFSKTFQDEINRNVSDCPTDCKIPLYRETKKTATKSIDNPSTVSRINYMHSFKQKHYMNASGNYNETSNTLYYALDSNKLQEPQKVFANLGDMGWEDVKFPCIKETVSGDAPGYRRVETGHQSCCADFTNRTKFRQGSNANDVSYHMCSDKHDVNTCTGSLISSQLCNKEQVESGQCFHIVTPNIVSDGWHSFCDGYENDMSTWGDIQFINAKKYDSTKPAYLINKAEMIRQSKYSEIHEDPKLYPEDDVDAVGFDYGLLSVSNSGVISVSCWDRDLPTKDFSSELKEKLGLNEEGLFVDYYFYKSKPENYDGMDKSARAVYEPILPDDCKVWGSYQTYEVTNSLTFNNDSAGILPIRWSTFTARPGDSIPIEITTGNPILVRSTGSVNSDNVDYIRLLGGNGLILVLDPEDDNIVNSGNYIDPEQWQCNMGASGSYGNYKPYRYSLSAASNDNPRHIDNLVSTFWICEEDYVPMWFSGYDFLNVKNTHPYMHTYNIATFKQFLPKYQADVGIEEKEDTSLEAKGCNANKMPSSMKIGGTLYSGDELIGISYDETDGASYKYIGADGKVKTILINDVNITDKAYEKYYPQTIVVNLPDKELTNVTIKAVSYRKATAKDKTSNVTRYSLDEGTLYKVDNEGDYVIDHQYNNLQRILSGNQAYYTFNYDNIDYKIKIESKDVITASCTPEGSYADTVAVHLTDTDETADFDTDITFEEGNSYYVLNNDQIFTRIGPFTGMHESTSGQLLPAVYKPYGMCRVGDRTINGGTVNGRRFIYDESYKGATFMFITAMHREKLDHYWRVEFTTPSAENDSSQNGSFCRSSSDALAECDRKEIPDIMVVDLSKTENAKTKHLQGTVIIYKDLNDLKFKNEYYYTVKYPAIGWNEEHVLLLENDPLAPTFLCDGRRNCASDEHPDIDLNIGRIFYRLRNGEDGCEISTLLQRTVYTFEYNQNEYTLFSHDLHPKEAICFGGLSCSGNLEPFRTVGAYEREYYVGHTSVIDGRKEVEKVFDVLTNPATYSLYLVSYPAVHTGYASKCTDSGYIYDFDTLSCGVLKNTTSHVYALDRAPYIVSCGLADSERTTIEHINKEQANIAKKILEVLKLLSGPTAVVGNSSTMTGFAPELMEYTNPYSLDLKTTALDDNSVDYTGKRKTGALIMQSNIPSFVSNKYFARCVPYWTTPKWMLMRDPGDPSTFNGFSAISGSYFVDNSKNTSINDIKSKYSIDKVWEKYGGMVTNVLYKQNCKQKKLNTLDITSDCSLAEATSFNANFKTRYNKQFIMAKPIINDPINTSDNNCIITATAGSKTATTSFLANEPFGNIYPTSVVNGFEMSNKHEDNNNVQKNATINGSKNDGMNFFKHSEYVRNMIGAGILHADWHVLQSNGVSTIFNRNENINFTTQGEYYVAGNLNHYSKAYCMPRKSIAFATVWSTVTSALSYQLTADIAFITASLKIPGLPETAVLVLGALATGAVATATSQGSLELAKEEARELPGGTQEIGYMAPEKPGYAKRECGVGTAFRVVPVPDFACLSGYYVKCSNDRINQYVGIGSGTDDRIYSYCKSSEYTNFRSEPMDIGSCSKIKYSISTGKNIGRTVLRYKDPDEKYLNSLIDAVGNYNEAENIYKEQCGVCAKSKSIYSYNGIYYLVDDVRSMPASIRTDEHCKGYIDDEGNTYKWITNATKITPFEYYTFANKRTVYNLVKSLVQDKLHNCDPSNNFEPNLDDEAILNLLKSSFLKAQIRNKASCVVNMTSLYAQILSQLSTTDSCMAELLEETENLSQAACNSFVSLIESIDGQDYYVYSFTPNFVSASCNDNKKGKNSAGIEPENLYDYNSITSYDQESILSKYGYGELVPDKQQSETSTTLTIKMPAKLKDITTGELKSYKKARLGFAYAGVASENPMYLYKDFRMINKDDLKRGYTVTLGNTTGIKNGKYLYFYIQPLNDQGKPDSSYDPNLRFNPSTSKYVNDYAISQDPLVYSFKDFDYRDNGSISVTAPRTGKLWFKILDSAELAANDNDADGKTIVFTADDVEDAEMLTNDQNVLATNSGYYQVKVKVQTDSEDGLDTMLKGQKKTGLNKLITTLVIEPIKKIFVGDYVCKRCTKDHTNICKRCRVNDHGDCEVKPNNSKETDEEFYNKDGYEKVCFSYQCETKPSGVGDADFYNATGFHKVCDYSWSNGLIGKVATAFLKVHLVYIAWFMLVVFSMFIIGFNCVMGKQKFDFNFMKGYLFRYALIMAFVNPNSLELYCRLFVKPAFNLAEGLSAYVAGAFSTTSYTANDPQNFTYAAFGPIDNIFRFWINKYTFEKILAILFSSWTGIIVVVLLLVCFVFFVISVIEVVVLYIVILIKMSLYLAIGPIVFLLLVHEGTAGKFTNWWKAIAGCISEQVCVFAALSVFGTLYYYILKGSMNFIYCWEPVLKIPILDITLFSMWRISGTMPAHMAELMGTIGEDSGVNTKGFNILTAFMLFIITCMMSKFVDKASGMGAGFFGQKGSMPAEIKQALQGVKKVVKDLPKKGAGAIKDKIGNKLSDGKKNESRTDVNSGGGGGK